MSKIVICALLIVVTSLCSESWALTITAPKQGEVFYPTNKVTVKAEPSPGENIAGVFITALQMEKGTIDFIPPYEFSFNIDADFLGVETIMVVAKLSNGTPVQTQVQITVILPSNVILKGIEVDPIPVFLYKLPLGSDPNKVRIAETASIGVAGIYSDGIKREITSSASGTIYASSDDKIVKVNSEGEITAQEIGTAKIIIRNGQYSAEVEVIVKPYRKK